MSWLTIIAIAVYIGFAAYNRFYGLPNNQQSKPQVMGEKRVVEATIMPSPRSLYQPHPTQTGKSNIQIQVDDTSDKNTLFEAVMVYPGAILIKEDAASKTYQTADAAETVYGWYKQQLENGAYQIRNNVKTRANDKFKAVLQGVSSAGSVKVTIDQENSTSQTLITLE